jgi:hypothetical protein
MGLLNSRYVAIYSGWRRQARMQETLRPACRLQDACSLCRMMAAYARGYSGIRVKSSIPTLIIIIIIIVVVSVSISIFVINITLAVV